MALRLYNRLVPLGRKVDVLSRLGGLALIVCAEKCQSSAPAPLVANLEPG